MLELTDTAIQEGIITPVFGFADANVVYSIEDFALQLRTDTVQGGDDLLPFMSYYRMSVPKLPERFNRRLQVKGIPVEDLGNGVYKYYKFVPANLRYQLMIWTRNALDINTFIRNYFKHLAYWKSGLSVTFKTGYTLNMAIDHEELELTDRIGPTEAGERGIIFNAAFETSVASWIDIGDPYDKKQITEITLNVHAGDLQESSLLETKIITP